MNVDIYPVRLPKEALDAAPENERLFHFLAGQAANDLNILSKLLLANSNDPEDASEPEKAASATIGLFLIRQMTSRIYETWKTFSTHYPAIYRAYEGKWSQECEDAWASITGYFNAKSLIARVRTKVGYHADVDAVKDAYALLSPDDELIDYINVSAGNSLYSSSSNILALATLHLSGIKDRDNAMAKVMADTIDAHRWFNAIIGEHFKLFMTRYILKDGDKDKFLEGKVELAAPELSGVVFPFFVGHDPGFLGKANEHLGNRRTKRRLAKSRSRP